MITMSLGSMSVGFVWGWASQPYTIEGTAGTSRRGCASRLPCVRTVMQNSLMIDGLSTVALNRPTGAG